MPPTAFPVFFGVVCLALTTVTAQPRLSCVFSQDQLAYFKAQAYVGFQQTCQSVPTARYFSNDPVCGCCACAGQPGCRCEPGCCYPASPPSPPPPSSPPSNNTTPRFKCVQSWSTNEYNQIFNGVWNRKFACERVPGRKYAALLSGDANTADILIPTYAPGCGPCGITNCCALLENTTTYQCNTNPPGGVCIADPDSFNNLQIPITTGSPITTTLYKDCGCSCCRQIPPLTGAGMFARISVEAPKQTLTTEAMPDTPPPGAFTTLISSTPPSASKTRRPPPLRRPPSPPPSTRSPPPPPKQTRPPPPRSPPKSPNTPEEAKTSDSQDKHSPDRKKSRT